MHNQGVSDSGGSGGFLWLLDAGELEVGVFELLSDLRCPRRDALVVKELVPDVDGNQGGVDEMDFRLIFSRCYQRQKDQCWHQH